MRLEGQGQANDRSGNKAGEVCSRNPKCNHNRISAGETELASSPPAHPTTSTTQQQSEKGGGKDRYCPKP